MWEKVVVVEFDEEEKNVVCVLIILWPESAAKEVLHSWAMPNIYNSKNVNKKLVHSQDHYVSNVLQLLRERLPSVTPTMNPMNIIFPYGKMHRVAGT